MKDIRCILGLHTGLTDSKYKYINHGKFREYNDLKGNGDFIAYYEKKCSRCNKRLKDQRFAFMWADEPHFSYERTKENAVKYAKEFTWNG